MIVRELSKAECLAALSANRVAKLACARDNRPYVVPLFYAYADGWAYAFTMPGRKLDTMRANPAVALLVEEATAGGWRSVVAEGPFEELPDRIGFKHQREHAWALLSRHADWWEPGALKPVRPPISDQSRHVFFRIHIETTSGREGVPE